jgi:hypothetical protein
MTFILICKSNEIKIYLLICLLILKVNAIIYKIACGVEKKFMPANFLDTGFIILLPTRFLLKGQHF